MRTPFSLLPLNCHTSALIICPPSRGRPGKRLNKANTKLSFANSSAIWAATCNGWGPWLRGWMLRNSNRASAKLTRGPAAATAKAPMGVGGSRSTLATPPSMKRVMLFTFTPSCWATREWPNSWSSTETNKSKAVQKPATKLPANCC